MREPLKTAPLSELLGGSEPPRKSTRRWLTLLAIVEAAALAAVLGSWLSR